MNSISTFEYYKTLFSSSDHICVARDPYGIATVPAKSIVQMSNQASYNDFQYVAINPFHPGTTRSAANVSVYRNILLEWDDIPLDDQLSLIKSLGVPYSTCTFSGSKSYHFVISLETPLEFKADYDFVVRWIYNILTPYQIDTKTKDCSRLSRVPNSINKKTQNKQTLIEVLPRVKNSILEEWIFQFPNCRPDIHAPFEYKSNIAAPYLLSNWTQYLLREGIFKGKRNAGFYSMAYDFISCGFTSDEAIAYTLENAKHLGDFPTSEVESTYKSAYKRMGKI